MDGITGNIGGNDDNRLIKVDEGCDINDEKANRYAFYDGFDCASSARVSVGARRLAQARRVVRRSGRVSDFTGLILRRHAAARSNQH